MKRYERPRDQEFADRLKVLMDSKGIKNNNQLAIAIGKPPMTTGTWLKGRIPTYRWDIEKLCDFFGVTADFLLLGRSSTGPVIKFEFPVTEKWKEQIEKIPPEERKEDQLLWGLMANFLNYRKERS